MLLHEKRALAASCQLLSPDVHKILNCSFPRGNIILPSTTQTPTIIFHPPLQSVGMKPASDTRKPYGKSLVCSLNSAASLTSLTYRWQHSCLGNCVGRGHDILRSLLRNPRTGRSSQNPWGHSVRNRNIVANLCAQTFCVTDFPARSMLQAILKSLL